MGRDGDVESVICQKNEATYESAIQSYETRMKSLANGGICCGDSEPKSSAPLVTSLIGGPNKFHSRRASAAKIEEKLGELERVKNRSVSSCDLSAFEANKKSLGIPKVNIFARKELFEKKSDETTDPAVRSGGLVALSEEVPRVRSIKERLSSLEKSIEEGNKPKNAAPLADVSVRDRLSSINEKLRTQSASGSPDKCIPSPATSSSRRSSAHGVSNSVVRVGQQKPAVCLPRSTCGLENESEIRPKEEAPTASAAKRSNREYSSSGRSSSSEDYENVHQHRVGHHFHHRSLDSLQGHDSPNGFCFERVQSLECVDCCGSNYPASVLSGDTDREDSGIHTADVSSSVSQADDFDLHADSSIDADVKGSPLTPTPAAVSVVDGVPTSRTNVHNSSQSGGCHSQDPFAEGEPSPTEPPNVSDLRRYDAPYERGDFSTTDSAGRLESPNNDHPIEVSSRRSFPNAFKPCDGTQLDRRLPTCTAGIYKNCGLVDERERVANETAATLKPDLEDESRTIDGISEPLISDRPMADASQLIDRSRNVEVRWPILFLTRFRFYS